MENPWLKIGKEAPHVLADEVSAILIHNKTATFKNWFWVDCFRPVPYVGDVRNAKVLLLMANPGVYMPPGFSEPPIETKYLSKEWCDLVLEKEWATVSMTNSEYPFDGLNPNFPMNGDFRYWSDKFSALLSNLDDYKRLSKAVACVEFFPYASIEYKAVSERTLRKAGFPKGTKYLPSQMYAANLVKEALQNNKLVVLMRAVGWKNLMKEVGVDIENNKNVVRLRSRNAKLTRKNFDKPSSYDRLLELVSE